MKTIVVYKSSTGFTKQYAQWIAEKCNCLATDIKKLDMKELNQYDKIIYGGWIMGNMIMGLGKLKNENIDKLVVFAVGSSTESEELKSTIREVNQLGNIPFFYFEGGFHFEKLSFPVKMMLKALKKSIAKKENKTEQEEMQEKLGTSFDHSNPDFIKPLVDFMNANEYTK